MISFYLKKILFSLFLSAIFLGCKTDAYHLQKITAKTNTLDSTISSDEEITKIINPYKEKMLSEINTVISYTPKDLVRTDGKLQSSLGNLLADLCYQRANPIFKKETGNTIDFAMFNYGGIRAGINQGKITNKHAFELMPFENTLVVVELSGEKIKDLVDYFIKNNIAHPLSKQLKLIIENDGSYQLFIHNKKFDQNKSYYVLTSNYLQSGGDRMNFFKDPISLFKTEYKVRDAIIDYFKSVDSIDAKTDNRIVIR